MGVRPTQLTENRKNRLAKLLRILTCQMCRSDTYALQILPAHLLTGSFLSCWERKPEPEAIPCSFHVPIDHHQGVLRFEIANWDVKIRVRRETWRSLAAKG